MRKNFQRIITFVFCLALVFCLCACREEEEAAPEAEGFEYIEAMNEALDIAQTEVESFENYTDKYEDALGDMGIYLD